MAEIRYDGRVAIITGAGSGLGRAYALLLASKGAKVVVNDLGGTVDGTGSGNAAAEIVCNEIKEAGGEAVPNFNSVAEWDEAGNIIKTATDAFGKVDILINNAGITRDAFLVREKAGEIKKMSLEQWKMVIDINLTGVFLCGREAAASMVERNTKGLIINISSISR